MRNFKDLMVWERSHELCLKVYEITRQFPDEEKYGLISQLRRASSSVPTNIAEGCGYDSNKEFCRFLRIASGSISEVHYLLILSIDLKYIREDKAKSLMLQVVSIRKMLFKLINAVL